MNTIIGIGGLIFVAAVTPGPNNFAVLEIASARGVRAAIPAIGGIVVGSITLLLLTQVGLDAVVGHHEWIRRAIAVGGASYLGYLGVSMVYYSFKAAAPRIASRQMSPRSAWALCAFQLTNPKAWILVLTAVAVARCTGCSAFTVTITLVALLTVIPTICLLAWALLGQVAARYMRGVRGQAWLARVMGMLLIASAVSLIAP